MPRLNLTEDETRNLVLDEAERLFGEVGYDKTTIADIAKACGFSTANVHRVLGTKSAINQAIAARKLSGKIAEARRAAGGAETAEAALHAFARSIYEQTKIMVDNDKRVHHMVAAAIEERWQEVTTYRRGLLKEVSRFIERGCDSGEFSVVDAETAARVFHTSAVRYFHPLLVAELEGSEGAEFDDWFAHIVASLKSR
ncbi:TetR/AcrR family transcriptional regulator [Parvularcula maris]|uniref:TetR/AcrR family transcriptional regulator n=1 Tax=Parvularcula maris TaxID=2965077 RepID=A0A9X2LAG3_9PROT|nr:TetR family transcriptional regulator [Parvularcula maris]MCQ8185966.1 TetR/AcrR family transcriptional regulator [Parvularcula maris]